MSLGEKHIVFDFDGVLCDSQNLSIESYSLIREKYFPFLPAIGSKEEYADIFAGDPDSCLYKWLSSNEMKFFYEEQTKFSYENSERMLLFDGIGELLGKVPRQQLSILTTNLKVSVEKILEREMGVDFIFEDLIFSKELRLPKKEMFQLLFQKRKTKPSDTFYVCDSEEDIKVCKATGINSIAVAFGYFPMEVLQKQEPTFQVKDVSELSLMVRNIIENDFKN